MTCNGCVHIVDRVVHEISSIASLISETPNLRIFSLLLSKTSWADSLVLYEDRDYRDNKYIERLRENYKEARSYPRYRKYGYTCFVEPDEVFHREWGVPLPVIDSETGGLRNESEILQVVEDKCRNVYSEAQDKDWRSAGNAVN